ncbi:MULTISPECIES: hypothetical protein [unclassified Nonomuraea]|uniref:hypothetical protein n=1 Tax=unclassified Nonomuraea TaxID=2593643 RepID=UPI0035C1C6C8
MSTLTRTLSAVTVAGLSALFLAAPQPAQAYSEISCFGAGDASFSSEVGMATESTDVSYRGKERSCIDHSGAGITSARFSVTFDDVPLSCAATHFGGVGSTGTAIIEWKMNGAKQISELDVYIDETMLNDIKIRGVVTKGVFKNRRFTGMFDMNLVGRSGKCATGSFDTVNSTSFDGDFSID